MDFKSLSTKELERQKARIEAELARRSQTAVRDIRKQMEKLAADAGLSLEEIVGTNTASVAPSKNKAAKPAKPAAKKPGIPAGQKIDPKYRNPENPSQIWTGRGREPLWVTAWVEKGGSRDALLISNQK